MSKFYLANMALKAAYPTNSILTDDVDMPSVMVFIPAFKLSEVIDGAPDSIHPAFIVNGKQIKGFYCSKYQNVSNNSRAYSLPCEDPAVNINADNSRSRCETKGRGWHLMSAWEWGALALWCKKNGHLPYGNNNYGKDSRETLYKAIPTYKDGNGATCRVATGTGPVTWSHDNTPAGIYDLNGNVYEWVDGFRLVHGEVQITGTAAGAIIGNDCADSEISKLASSANWFAIDAATGKLITPDGNGTTTGSVKLDFVSSKWTYSTTITSKEASSRQCLFGNVTTDATIGDEAKLILQALAVLPADSDVASYEGDYFYANNGEAERFVHRGGYWSHGALYGVFLFDGNDTRAHTSTSVGYRSAFIEELATEN